jgi:hypothetical protein
MSWDDLLDRMVLEGTPSRPRLETYWAQQLAFSPVLVHALRLRIRGAGLPPEAAASIIRLVRLALSGLAALPEESGADPIALTLLARRQARALQWGRRHSLRRILERLGEPASALPEFAPSRMVRAYPLLGWKPEIGASGFSRGP